MTPRELVDILDTTQQLGPSLGPPSQFRMPPKGGVDHDLMSCLALAFSPVPGVVLLRSKYGGCSTILIARLEIDASDLPLACKAKLWNRLLQIITVPSTAMDTVGKMKEAVATPEMIMG